MVSQLSLTKLQQKNHSLQAELTKLRSRYESLQQSEARYRQAFENAPISMLFISSEGKPIEMNSAAEQFLGWTIAEANETGFNGFTETTLLENGTISSFEKAIAGETVIEPPIYFDPGSTIGQGQWKWAQGHYYPIRDAAGQVQEVVEVALDLTAMYKVQQKLAQERTSLLQASAQVANLLLRASDYTTVLPDVVRLLGEAVGSDRCGVLRNTFDQKLKTPATQILAEWCNSSISYSVEATPELEQGFLWDYVSEYRDELAQGKIANLLTASLRETARSIFEQQGTTSMLIVPILFNENFWGIISFDNCGEPRLYDEAEIAILQVAAESLAAAIARQAKDEELRESERRYRTLFELSSEGILRFGYHQPIPLSLSVEEQLELCYESVYIAESNAAFARMYEYEKTEDMIGLTLNDLHDRESEVTQATMWAYVEDKHSARNTETVELDRYGRKRYFLNSSVSTIENNCVVSTWVSQVDITELREAQQELLEVEQERSQQLESLNIELQQTVDSLENRDRILAATAKASNVLLTGKDFDQSVNQALQIIGKSINTDRISIVESFDNPEDPLYLYWKITYEWDSAFAVSQLNHPEVSQGSYEGIEEWYELLTQGESISRQLGELSEPFRSGQAKIGLKTLYVVPILIEGKYWGSIGIDDCQEETHRSEAELSILKTAAACIGSAIQRDRTQKAILKAEQERSQQLESLNIELQQTVDSLENRDRILAATAEASNILLTGKDFDQSVNQTLQIIGKSIDTDRIAIVENFENPEYPLHLYWKITYEWDSAYAVSQLNHPEVSQGSYEGIETWYELWNKGQTISCQLEEMSEPFRSKMAKIGLRTFSSVPIFIEGKYWGNIGIDDCREETHRSEAELSILKTAAACIGSAIQRDRTQKAILKAEQERVAELSTTNKALKNSLDRLADEPALDAFLGHVLTETSQQLQLDFGYLFFYNKSDLTLDLHMFVTPEGAKLKHQLEKTSPFCKTFSVGDLPIWDTLLQTRKPFIIDRKNAEQYVFKGTLEWQTQQQEHHTGINILLTLGDQPIGLLALVSTKCSFTPQEVELAQALSQQVTLAIQLTRLAEEAKQSAIFEERNRLAGEIHDTLAQTFTGISVQLELAQYLSQHNPTEVKSILDRIGSLAQTGLTEARRSVWSVYSAGEKYADLAQKLADCVEHLTLGTDLHTEVNIDGNPYSLSCLISKNLLRIGQEAITNTLKHAQAREIQVKLTYTPNQVSLCISDNGCGFCPQNQTEGFGLIGISERTDRIGGQLRITTQPGQGTEIFVQVSL